jgi:SAM-dependent methyltransferase
LEFRLLQSTGMNNQAHRIERERQHFNRMAEEHAASELTMPKWNIDRYQQPAPDTPFPLEYAFTLLGDIKGRTIVDLGCGEGLNTVILAALGANVISVDVSDKSLELTGARVAANGLSHRVRLVNSDASTIPVEDGVVDGVLCVALLHHVDCVATAKQIQRVLKPGGTAVFLEPLVGPRWFQKLKAVTPKGHGVSEDEVPLTPEQVNAVNQAIGRGGKAREFLVTTRLLNRFGINSWPAMQKSHRLDAWLVHRSRLMSALASPSVWEARKVA